MITNDRAMKILIREYNKKFEEVFKDFEFTDPTNNELSARDIIVEMMEGQVSEMLLDGYECTIESTWDVLDVRLTLVIIEKEYSFTIPFRLQKR